MKPFGAEHAKTLPLELTLELCARGKTTWTTGIKLRRFVFKETAGDPRDTELKRKNFTESAFQWAKTNRHELEAILIERSTRVAFKFSTEINKRMSLENERTFQEDCYRQKNTIQWWLKYCEHFKIIPENHAQIVIETAFGKQDDKNQAASKRYISVLEDTKNKTLDFILEIMKSESLNEHNTIKELIEKLRPQR